MTKGHILTHNILDQVALLDYKFEFERLEDNKFSLKIHSKKTLSLSTIIPKLECLGFEVLEENGQYNFLLQTHIILNNDFNTTRSAVQAALDEIFTGTLEPTPVCSIILASAAKIKHIKALVAITKYLDQIGFEYGSSYVLSTLAKHYSFAGKLIEYFDLKFNPEYSTTESILETTEEFLEAYLTNVESPKEDKALFATFGIINAIVRTNLYQQTQEGYNKDYISFKIDPSKIRTIPLPVPYREIFVYSKDFEGTHIRYGKVARGGIRLSDRHNDYRFEVASLAATQNKKNTVIVPVGSKGGIVLKFNYKDLSKDEYLKKVKDCYCNFLRGLLDITDNIIHGQITSPTDTVIYDEQDPYLVVAADKGTATFSDYANEISKEYNFWLSDGFASGGSNGYDHKKIGITSRGAWISAKRHFSEFGLNIDQSVISAVGIGDMSGDVFGNGMLMSKNIKLVAAFNHSHIFVDPNPNLEISFKERQRLFQLKGSKWTDYDKNLLSKGAGVFDRNSKIINLTPEIISLLDISEEEVTPEELIQYILKAPVDLIWNGGIGTYFKASTESHAQISDKDNDHVRINALDIRAKVIGEGGNLGFSQKARIEYSRIGGRINTDFIDNSAGVDCSDHEVNIKIALSKALISNKIDEAGRRDILSNMTDEVADLVLQDNYEQTRAVTFSANSKMISKLLIAKFLDRIENKVNLDRDIECLPSTSEILKNIDKLTRPEFCVVLSYSKMYVYDEISKSDIAENKFLESYLIEYFPGLMQNQFKEEILNHPLKKEIISTVITNKIVNHLTGPLLFSIEQETGSSIVDIAKAYIIVTSVFKLSNTFNEIDELKAINFASKISLYDDIVGIIKSAIIWFINNTNLEIDNLIKEYQSSLELTKILSSNILKELPYQTNCQTIHQLNEEPSSLQMEMQNLESRPFNNLLLYGTASLSVISISQKLGINQEQVIKVYFDLQHAFSIDKILKACYLIELQDYESTLALEALKDEILLKHYKIVLFSLKHSIKPLEQIDDKIINSYNNFIVNTIIHEEVKPNHIILCLRKLSIILSMLDE